MASSLTLGRNEVYTLRMMLCLQYRFILFSLSGLGEPRHPHHGGTIRTRMGFPHWIPPYAECFIYDWGIPPRPFVGAEGCIQIVRGLSIDVMWIRNFSIYCFTIYPYTNIAIGILVILFVGDDVLGVPFCKSKSFVAGDQWSPLPVYLIFSVFRRRCRYTEPSRSTLHGTLQLTPPKFACRGFPTRGINIPFQLKKCRYLKFLQKTLFFMGIMYYNYNV